MRARYIRADSSRSTEVWEALELWAEAVPTDISSQAIKSSFQKVLKVVFLTRDCFPILSISLWAVSEQAWVIQAVQIFRSCTTRLSS